MEDKKAPYKQRYTAKRVYDRLKEKYSGVNASDRVVRTVVAKLRKN